MAVRYEDWCVGCPPEMGCMGSCCPNRNVPIYVCDKCEEEHDAIYQYDGNDYCRDCFLDLFEQVDDDIYLVDGEKVYVDDLVNHVGAEVLAYDVSK